jgi:hypothetical protein
MSIAGLYEASHGKKAVWFTMTTVSRGGKVITVDAV